MKLSVQVPLMCMIVILVAMSVSGGKAEKAGNSAVVRNVNGNEKIVPETEHEDIVEEVRTTEGEDADKINDAEKSYSNDHHYKKLEPKVRSGYGNWDSKPDYVYGYKYKHQPKYKPKPYHCSKTCYTTYHYASKKCRHPYHVVSCKKKYKKCYKKYHYGSYKRHCVWAYKSGYGCSCYYH